MHKTFESASRDSAVENIKKPMSTIRPATPEDFSAIKVLNDAVVALTSPMDVSRIASLHAISCYHRVVEEGGAVSAFLLVFGPASGYNSPYYQWFDQRYDDYAYIDRIVVRDRAQGQGRGRMLYENLFSWAGQREVHHIVCEYNAEPLNEVSRKFHAALGFKEISIEKLSATKQVSMQLKTLDE
ncbi:MAG: GNAT family N-acetyltransferase [Pseudomonadota bacterium]|nr:GNAT family N-acetyltransferase [Pseudomonadota bacterium]